MYVYPLQAYDPNRQNPAARISGHQQSWGYREGPSKSLGHALLAAAE
jgi:hypothetical protein